MSSAVQQIARRGRDIDYAAAFSGLVVEQCDGDSSLIVGQQRKLEIHRKIRIENCVRSEKCRHSEKNQNNRPKKLTKALIIASQPISQWSVTRDARPSLRSLCNLQRISNVPSSDSLKSVDASLSRTRSGRKGTYFYLQHHVPLTSVTNWSSASLIGFN